MFDSAIIPPKANDFYTSGKGGCWTQAQRHEGSYGGLVPSVVFFAPSV